MRVLECSSYDFGGLLVVNCTVCPIKVVVGQGLDQLRLQILTPNCDHEARSSFRCSSLGGPRFKQQSLVSFLGFRGLG